MRQTLRSLSTALALLFCAGNLPQGAAQAGSRATSFTLANGLQLVVIPDHRLPVVTHMVFYRAGSADDPPGQSGLAHYLEHLMFKGTVRYPTGTYDLMVTRAGGTNNAYTSTDKTYYYEQFLAEALPRIMDLNADRMAGLAFAPSEAASELKVVDDERRSYDNDPDSVLALKVGRALYAGGPYAHPVIGETNELSHLTLDAALAFHRSHYGPATAIVVVAGDVEPAAVFALAQTTYGHLPGGAASVSNLADVPLSACADGRIVEHSSRLTRTQISQYYLTPGSAHLGLRTAAALELLANILQSEVTSPLWDDLVTQRHLASDLGVGHDLRIGAGEFSINVETAEGIAPERLERALDAAMRGVRRDGIDAEALAIAKRRWLSDHVLSSDDQLGEATRYGEQLAAGRTVAEIESEPDVIAAVTLPDINGVLAKFVSNHCYLTTVLAPEAGSAENATPSKAFLHPAMAVH